MTVLERVHVPSPAGATGWLGAAPLGPAELHGHVVMVYFWTLRCINWLPMAPHVRAWSRACRDDRLIVIGVHTPEFSFEHEIDNMRRATVARDIDYPVVVGLERSERFKSRSSVAFDQRRTYELPDRLPLNDWAIAGDGTIGREKVVLEQHDGGIAYRFHARDPHLVLSSGAQEPGPGSRPGSSRARRTGAHASLSYLDSRLTPRTGPGDLTSHTTTGEATP